MRPTYRGGAELHYATVYLDNFGKPYIHFAEEMPERQNMYILPKKFSHNALIDGIQFLKHEGDMLHPDRGIWFATTAKEYEGKTKFGRSDLLLLEQAIQQIQASASNVTER